MLRCSICGTRVAEIKQPHTGLRLCRECFIEQIRNRVLFEIKRWNMFEDRHKLLLALSGGKDSFTLLDIITNIHKNEKIIALSIKEGIPGGYHINEIESIRKIVKQYGIDHLIVEFRDYTGMNLSDIVQEANRRRLNVKPCTFCGVLRRRIMEEYAKHLGVDRVVTAHNLDDEAQTAIMNILRGDIVGLIRQHPLAVLSTRDFVPRVKPLRKIYEWETATYAFKQGYMIQSMECPYLYEAPTLRLRVRLNLYNVERKSPGSLLRLLETLDILLKPLVLEQIQSPVKLSHCIKCGAPTSPERIICKVCELLEAVGTSIHAIQVGLPHPR